jgi:hypothetical protein
VLVPLVLGPDRVPLVTDAAEASRAPELAVLSAVAHATHPERDKILHALLSALHAVDGEHAVRYSDVVLAALPVAARNYLEALMTSGTYEIQSEFIRRYFCQGEAEALLEVLAARGIDVPDDARARITGCTDINQLLTWVRRAVTADSISGIFD